MAAVTVLDIEFLRQFIKNHIDEFRMALEGIAKDDDTQGWSVTHITEHVPRQVSTELVAVEPLIIGPMAKEANGAALNKHIQADAEAIGKVLADQNTLFEDLKDALGEVIKKMEARQVANLQDIPMDTFTDALDSVDSVLADHDSPDEESD